VNAMPNNNTGLWFWEETAQPARGWTYPLFYCNKWIRWCITQSMKKYPWKEYPGKFVHVQSNMTKNNAIQNRGR
jgi:hypothetical protein